MVDVLFFRELELSEAAIDIRPVETALGIVSLQGPDAPHSVRRSSSAALARFDRCDASLPLGAILQLLKLTDL
jgi:hypothetical protein